MRMARPLRRSSAAGKAACAWPKAKSFSPASKTKPTGTVRSFCARCGTPIFYERPHAPKWVNIPRSLFTTRTGREPRYHFGLAEAAEWEYRGEALKPLKGYPGVMIERPRKKKPTLLPD